MNRRDWLRGFALGAAGLAVSSLGIEKHLDMPKQESVLLAGTNQNVDFEQFANELLPDFIYTEYDLHLEETDERRKKYESLKEKVENASRSMGIELCSEEATKLMRDKGYVFYCLPSAINNSLSDEVAALVGRGKKSYFFGRISDQTVINGFDWSKYKAHKILFYDELAPNFENYSSFAGVSGRHMNAPDDVIIVDRTQIMNDSKFKYDQCQRNKTNPKIAGDFYFAMISKLCGSAGSPEKLYDVFVESVIYHELGHEEHKTGADGEMHAFLNQMIRQPYFGLATIEANSRVKEAGIHKTASERIFELLDAKGYSRAKLLECNEPEISDVARKIMEEN